jgi:hypothetical protein
MVDNHGKTVFEARCIDDNLYLKDYAGTVTNFGEVVIEFPAFCNSEMRPFRPAPSIERRRSKGRYFWLLFPLDDVPSRHSGNADLPLPLKTSLEQSRLFGSAS